MEAFGIVIGLAIAAFSIYQAVVFFGGFTDSSAPQKDDEVLGKTASVYHVFSGLNDEFVRTGTVLIDGRAWEAETTNCDFRFGIGDKCIVYARKGDRLCVEPKI